MILRAWMGFENPSPSPSQRGEGKKEENVRDLEYLDRCPEISKQHENKKR